ncbi:hypothetical protein COCC4DRAFT_136432 [Bipolaris maydis ATCC 48331]|uniref:Uncharacterized protein n=2 Tax=Cochliobolus heterostrophus TaxID=5016 RepID=M2TWR4_COCH5|nr:uncharacterized protein COCC4DRAFT_136432 [Bipolaris maydis ATCC 48331]EMD90959.1 hypothetical protein COCHEDRAFT_1030724 [Bipolaris maydis C5]ENI05957.1 hypothetical protein COCC4DRAFT_136432 [Bipolaris maydis ATCC 48331]
MTSGLAFGLANQSRRPDLRFLAVLDFDALALIPLFLLSPGERTVTFRKPSSSSTPQTESIPMHKDEVFNTQKSQGIQGLRTKDTGHPLKIIGTASFESRSNADLKKDTMSKLTKTKHLTLPIVSICSELISPRAGSAKPAKFSRI